MLFGILQIIIDSCCATFAEIQKRGKDFWAEFELYAADLLVGVVVNVALVGMLAPYARFGQVSTSNSILGHMTRAYGALPSRYEFANSYFSFQPKIVILSETQIDSCSHKLVIIGRNIL